VPQQLDTIQRKRLERLLEISTSLSSTLDIKQLFDIVLQAITDLTNCEASSILLLDNVSGQLFFAAASGPNPPDDKTAVPVDASFAGVALRDGKSLVVVDVCSDEKHFADISHFTGLEARNLVAVPLNGKHQPVGAIEAINKIDAEGFSDQDLVMLETLASQASVAIQTAHLFHQTDLIAEFMHELKTPLMALTAASEILSRESNALSPKQRELLEMVERETAHLSQMAQEFLELARLESGRAQLVHEIVYLPSIVAETVRLQEPQAEKRNVSIKSIIKADLPPITGDANRLKQVLINLTSNAIKYNMDYGLVTIELKASNGDVVI